MIEISDIELDRMTPRELGSLLYSAVNYGSIEYVKKIIRCGADLDIQGGFMKWIPLHRAADLEKVEICRALIEAGADVDLLDTHSETALHFATVRGSAEICRMLVEAGAVVDIQGSYERTALHRAAQGGHLEICKLLVEAGAGLDIRDRKGDMPLDLARVFCQPRVVEYLEGLGK